jgi:UPF0755 protein
MGLPLSQNSDENKPDILQRIGQELYSSFLIGFVICVLAAVASVYAPGPLSEEKTVVIPHGASVGTISHQLSEENTIYLATPFHIVARFISRGSLKAGEYAIPARASTMDIITMMHEGRSVVRLFTVAEGLTSAEIVQQLQKDPVLTGEVNPVPLEGSLLPETYRYSYGDSRMSLITRMQKSMQDKLNEVWAAHDSDLLLKSPQEVVILASIVEKETGKVAERPRIAGVFYNRLQHHMRLQSDPTVIYALTGGKMSLNRELEHGDLTFASPINTYANDGLPPQPICNPGRAALEAVVHPEHHDFLYFVADGTGGHAFASTLAAHNDNINKWHQVIDNAAAPK